MPNRTRRLGAEALRAHWPTLRGLFRRVLFGDLGKFRRAPSILAGSSIVS